MVDKEYTRDDCIKDTMKHINQVRENIMYFIEEMMERSKNHDLSKLKQPELDFFTKYTPLLRSLTYGSEEYKKCLEDLKVALDHHYKNNSHHPEFYENGVDGMDLFDVVEMVCDWMAAVKRHDDGNIYESLKINKERFGLSDQLYNIIKNTVDKFEK